MIKRDRSLLAIPESLTKIECQNCLSEIVADILSGDDLRIKQGKSKISEDYYRGSRILPDDTVEQDVAIALRDLYDKKCAFCESKRTKPQVEHFRPKKRVTGVSTTGYYWLCYEWTNLLPCCPDCNETKGTSFPLLEGGVHKTAPMLLADNTMDSTHNDYSHDYLLLENPKLIHPEYVNPQLCFTYNSLGEISGIDDEGKGEETKTKLGLHREDLNWWRQKEIDYQVKFFEMALCLPEDDKFIEVLNKLRDSAMDKRIEYTLLFKIMYNNFKQIISPQLGAGRERAERIYDNNRILIDLSI